MVVAVTRRNWGRLFRWAPVVLWAGLIFILSSRPVPTNLPFEVPYLDKVVHFGLFFVLAFFLFWATNWQRDVGVVVCVFVCALFGVSDEIHQMSVPGRHPDIWDVVADLSGAFTMAAIWRWRRHRNQRPKASVS